MFGSAAATLHCSTVSNYHFLLYVVGSLGLLSTVANVIGHLLNVCKLVVARYNRWAKSSSAFYRGINTLFRHGHLRDSVRKPMCSENLEGMLVGNIRCSTCWKH